MTGESKLGLGLIALLAVCCAGPLVLSLLATGAVLGALSAIWVEDRPLLLGSRAIAVALAASLLARRSARIKAAPRRPDAPGDRVGRPSEPPLS
jgi:hypothetical protein